MSAERSTPKEPQDERRITAEFMVLESERDKLDELIVYAKRLGISSPHIDSFVPRESDGF